jgi:phosphinothricin acetyltransferase
MVDESVAGYAGTHEYHTKRAYETTVETTIYVTPGFTGRGIGSLLYSALFASLAGEDVEMAVAGVALPNEASLRLHKRFGFESAGTLHRVGRKFEEYWDVAWLEKPLNEQRR